MIFDISGEGGLKARIDNLKDQFSKAGGANELAKIRKKQRMKKATTEICLTALHQTSLSIHHNLISQANKVL